MFLIFFEVRYYKKMILKKHHLAFLVLAVAAIVGVSVFGGFKIGEFKKDLAEVPTSESGVGTHNTATPALPKESQVPAPWGYLEYAFDDSGRYLLTLDVSGFESERIGGTLSVFDSVAHTLKKISGVEGFAILPGTNRALIAKTFSLDPDGNIPATDTLRFDEIKLKIATREIGVPAASLKIRLVGGKPASVTTALFILDLTTLAVNSLRTFSGEGGIYMNEDGTIYVSGDATNIPANRASTKLLVGTPYYTFNTKKNTLDPVPPAPIQYWSPSFFKSIVTPQSLTIDGADDILAQTDSAKISRRTRRIFVSY